MKTGMATTVGLLLALSACSGQSVPDRQAAIQAMAKGDYATARVLLANALQVNSADPELHFLMGKVALESGNTELAKSELQPLLTHPRYGSEARTLLAQAYLISGSAKLALETLQPVPLGSGLAYAIAVGAREALGDDEAAAALLAKGLAAFPNSPELLQVDAEAALTSGDLAHAKTAAAKVAKLAPNDRQALILAGRIALIEGDKQQADQLFDRVLQQDKGNTVALLAKAAIAHERGDKGQTNALLARADQASGGALPQTKAYMAQMAIEAGDINRANQIMQALPEQGEVPYFMMLRGIIAGARGLNEQAITLLRNFFAHGGENAAARVALSNALAATGDKPQAWMVLRPLADAANANAPVLALAARLSGELKLPEAPAYQARLHAAQQPDPLAADMVAADQAIGAGDWKKADAIYQRLLAANPASTSVVLLNNAANARLQLGDKAQAVALARRAAVLAPNDPIVADSLGWALFQQGGVTPEVIALMRRAYAAQPGNPDIRTHLAVISKTGA